jgi:predicted metal-dependent enzyme (double-stranded beta helix superfamily)
MLRGGAERTSTTAEAASERERAVDACIGDVKAIIGEQGVTRGALERVKGRLLELAERRDLFSFEALPLLHQGSTMHLLSEDEDHGFALYAVAAHSASKTPPHDHTTWAVVVGVEGTEVNRHWRRVDAGAEAGAARLEEAGVTVVEPGTGVALMPDDIHSIERASDAPMLHFHLYGRSIEHLPERKQFDRAAGTYKVYPANPNIQR